MAPPPLLVPCHQLLALMHRVLLLLHVITQLLRPGRQQRPQLQLLPLLLARPVPLPGRLQAWVTVTRTRGRTVAQAAWCGLVRLRRLLALQWRPWIWATDLAQGTLPEKLVCSEAAGTMSMAQAACPQPRRAWLPCIRHLQHPYSWRPSAAGQLPPADRVLQLCRQPAFLAVVLHITGTGHRRGTGRVLPQKQPTSSCSRNRSTVVTLPLGRQPPTACTGAQ